MASPGGFQVSIVTPERIALECEARFVALPAHDGELGVLRNRAPLLCKLDVGKLRIETAEKTEIFYVDGGFAEMADNRLTVLTEAARRPDELDAESAKRELEEARALEVSDDASFEARQRALRRARTQLRLLG